MTLTQSQEAAAFHGMATNAGYGVHERLELALRALELYEAEVESLRAQIKELETDQDR